MLGRRRFALARILVLAAVCLLLNSGSRARAADPQPPAEQPIAISDDFAVDVAGRYQSSPAARWQKSSVTLAPGGRLLREVAMGPSAAVTVEWSSADLKRDGDSLEFQFGLMCLDGSAGVGVISQSRQAGKTSAEAIIAALEVNENGQRTARVVRRFPLAEPNKLSGTWRVRYHFGVVEMFRGQKRVAIGDVGRGDFPLGAAYFAQEVGSGELRSLAIAGRKPKPAAPKEVLLARREALEKYGQANDRAFAFLEKRQLDDALEAAQQALAFAEEVSGKDQGSALSALGLVALCHDLDGRHDLALPLYQRVYEAWRRQVGDAHPLTARALRSVGTCQQSLKKLPAARRALEQSTKVFYEVFGPAHRESAFTRMSLAQILQEQGQAGLAQQNFEEALRSYEAAFGKDSPELLLPLQSLATLHLSVGNDEAARPLTKRALDIATKAHGADSPEAAQLRKQLDELPPEDEAPEAKPDEASCEDASADNESAAVDGESAPADEDDFRADPRETYVVSGEIDWKPGQVALKPGARLSQQTPCGLTATVTIVLAAESADENEGSETRIGLVVGHAPLEVALVYPKPATKRPNEVRVEVTLRDEQGRRRRTLVRAFPAPDDPRGEWTVRYNHAMVEISHAGKEIGAAWSIGQTEIAPTALFVAQPAGESRLSRWTRKLSEPGEDRRLEVPPDFWRQLGDLNDRFGKLTKRPGKLPEALEVATEGYELCREHLGETSHFTLSNQGKIAFALEQMGRARETIAVRERIVAARREAMGEAHPDYAFALRDLATSYVMANQKQPAIGQLESCLAILRRVLGDEDREVLMTELQLANTLMQTVRHREAAAHLQSALAGFEKRSGPDSLELCLPLEMLANFHVASAEPSQAVECWRRALQIRSAIQDPHDPQTLKALRSLSRSLNRSGRYSEARTALEQAIAALEARPDDHPLELAELRISLANLLSDHGDHEYAGRLIEASVAQMETLPTDDDLGLLRRRGSALYDLGLVLSKVGDSRRAEITFRRAADLLETGFGKDNPVAAEAHEMLGLIYLQQGRLTEARRTYLDVLARNRRALGDNSANVVSTLFSLGDTEERLGDIDAAWQYLQQAATVSEAVLGPHHATTAFAQRDLAAMLAKLGREKEARRLLQQSLATIQNVYGQEHPLVAQAFTFEGTVAIQLDDWRWAARSLQLAFQMNLELCKADLALLPEAQALRHVAVMEASRASYLGLCATVHRNGPALAAKLKSVPDISVDDIYRRVWQSRALATRTLVRPAVEAGDRRQDELREVRAQIASLTFSPPEELPRDEYRRRLQQLTDRKERLQRQLAVAAQPAPTEPTLDFADAVRRLPAGVAIVDLLRVPGPRGRDAQGTGSAADYEAFVLKRQAAAPGYALAWVHLGEVEPIDKHIDRFRAVSGKRGLGIKGGLQRATSVWRESSTALGKRVWNKLVPHLDGCETVIVVPDGPLAFVPWYALPGRKPGTFVIDDVAVGTAMYAQQVFELLERPAAEGDRMLLAGGIDYGTASLAQTEWPNLPGTRNEVNAVAELWSKRGECETLSGPGATKTRLETELPGARYVHLATHGFFADPKYRSPFDGGNDAAETHPLASRDIRLNPALRNPLALTGVVLAGANRRATGATPEGAAGGILTGEEVDACDLRDTELVVLSACETGLGAVAGGEGVFGLQRAFHLAGARTVVASLWKVDDTATKTLMVEFYRNLWEKKRSRIEALREAQSTMLHQYDFRRGELRPADAEKDAQPPPFFWAAFVLSGDWR